MNPPNQDQDQGQGQPIAEAELPEPIRTYLDAHEVRDLAFTLRDGQISQRVIAP